MLKNPIAKERHDRMFIRWAVFSDGELNCKVKGEEREGEKNGSVRLICLLLQSEIPDRLHNRPNKLI